MKYQFCPSQKKHPRRGRRTPPSLRGRGTLRSLPPSQFFQLSDPLPYLAPIESQRKNRFSAWMAQRRAKRKERREKKERLPLPLLSGVFLGILSVTLVTGSIFLLILFAPMGRRYETVTVPDLVGKEPTSLTDVDLPLNFVLQYEQNPTVPSGLVISQTPKGGVVRRVYADEDYPTVVLTVSRAPSPYSLEDLTGHSLRDAELILKNQSLLVTVHPTASSKEAGTVLSTDPPAGASLLAGDHVSLFVSEAPSVKRAYVPSLIGLSESAARERLQYAGFSVGSIQYKTSKEPVGTVIDQQYSAHTVMDAGSEISLWISLGEKYELRLVPDLYGRSEKEAREFLRAYGLTVGNVYTVGNAAPRGTVITQSPLPGTPLGASVWSVDLFVSSSYS